jgi:hypothetical protein
MYFAAGVLSLPAGAGARVFHGGWPQLQGGVFYSDDEDGALPSPGRDLAETKPPMECY